MRTAIHTSRDQTWSRSDARNASIEIHRDQVWSRLGEFKNLVWRFLTRAQALLGHARRRSSASRREAELPDVGSQAELGNQKNN